MKFRKKPVVIDAEQYDGFANHLSDAFHDAIDYSDFGGSAYIKTLEGVMECKVGDWLIRGVKGEVYPCKPDIFDATYEPVKEQA